MSECALIQSRGMLVLFTFFAGIALPVAAATDARVSESYGRLPLHFEENRGQVHKDVRFLARGPGYGLYLTAGEAVLALGEKDRTVLRMALVGANADAQASGLEELPGKANYFVGKDPAKWRTNVPTYGKVRYREVYKGIDLVYYGNQRQLEYDFVVAPGADPEKILLRFDGADAIRIDAQGNLVLHTANGELRQHKPVVYQEIDGTRREIDGRYVLKDSNRVGFLLAAYDTSRPMVIDPVLAYSTYLGGTLADTGAGIAVDVLGNAYVTGVASDNFPTTQGAFQTSCAGAFFSGCANAFVTKLDPSGALVYSTYFGYASAFAIAVDIIGSAYVTGSVDAIGAATFPTTAGAFQPSFAGGTCGSGGYPVRCRDAFIVKLDPTGSTLIYSTFLGGSGMDEGRGIAVDAIGSAYVTGSTGSMDFPTTAEAYQSAFADAGRAGSFTDAFVTKLDATGSALVYSTYLGGLNDNRGRGIAVDVHGNAHVTGITGSGFPTTPGALQPTSGGDWDAFVTKLSLDGSALVYSTFLGGCASDTGSGIAIDGLGNTHVAGTTSLTSLTCPATSNDFPTTAGAFQPTFGGGGGDAFVTKLDPTGTLLVYSTYLGGADYDEAHGIATDADGRAHVTGGTRSANFPATAGIFQPGSLGGNCVGDPSYAPNNAFVTTLDHTGSGLVYSAYLGGSDADVGRGIAIDGDGNAYVTGSTASNDFPTTAGAFQATCRGSEDAFVAKIAGAMLSPQSAATRSEENSATYGGYWPSYGPETGTFSGGAVRASNQATATATFTFTGSAVSWIGVKCNVCGIATVQIDGGAPTVVDTFGPGEPGSLTSEPVFTASGLAPDVTHTLTIVVTGGGTAAPTSARSVHVAVDAFDVTK